MFELPKSIEELLHNISQSDNVKAIDLQFARFLASLDPSRAEVLVKTGSLLSLERSRGHSCISLAEWAEATFPGEASAPLPSFPAAEEWVDSLRESLVVGEEGEKLPLLLDKANRLYLYRFWRAEQNIAGLLAQKLDDSQNHELTERVQDIFLSLFETGESDEINWQAVAAASALRHPFLMLSGGPGTGKTTTVARILALLVSLDPALKITLATPTGKAAQRLGSSIEEQITSLPLKPAQRALIPTEATTIHRMLGYHPESGRYRYHAEKKIDTDVLIVDESSMIDLLLFEAMLHALPSHTRLILIGDPYQLASVDAGFVFGDLCRGGEQLLFGPEFAEYCRKLGNINVPQAPTSSEVTRLNDAVVTLQKNYRFDRGSGVGQLASFIHQGKPDSALKCLEAAQYPDAQLHSLEGGQDWILTQISDYAKRLCQSKSIEAALQMLDEFKLLSTTRRGPLGVEGLNHLVERWLLTQKLRPETAFYKGRPILITANDYKVDLFNGDVGVCWQDENQTVACFSDGKGGIRLLPLAKLPPHESAWAMTVHKSQGSEFQHVLLALPEKPDGLMTRELLYTAVTRARSSITILGQPEGIKRGINNPERRSSGLKDSLAQQNKHRFHKAETLS